MSTLIVPPELYKAQLVTLGGPPNGKGPIPLYWGTRWATPKQCEEAEHWGIVPASAGAAVIDIDLSKDTSQAFRARQAAHALLMADVIIQELGVGQMLRSLSGGVHLWIPVKGQTTKGHTWVRNGLSGQIRSNEGYVLMADDPMLVVEALDAYPVRIEDVCALFGIKDVGKPYEPRREKSKDELTLEQGYRLGNRNEYMFWACRWRLLSHPDTTLEELHAWAAEVNAALAQEARERTGKACPDLPRDEVESCARSADNYRTKGTLRARNPHAPAGHQGLIVDKDLSPAAQRRRGIRSVESRRERAHTRNVQIIEAVREGMSVAAVAQETGLSERTVRRLTVRARAERKAREEKTFQGNVRRLAALGLTLNQIAQGLNVSVATVKRAR